MCGVRCSQRVVFLEPALSKFLKYLDRYCEATNGDMPHYYNERATLSLLSAACWETDLVALEEYVSPKNNTKYGRGRTDFWVKHPISGRQATIEAKQFFMDDPKKIEGCINKCDESAIENIDFETLCSLSFFSPSVSLQKNQNDINKLFEEFKENILSKGVDSLTWWLPKRATNGFRRSDNKEAQWPFLIAALRVVQIGNQKIEDRDADRLKTC